MHSAEIPAPPLPLWRDVAAGAQVSMGDTHAVPLGDCIQGARASRRSRGSRGRGSQTRHREARSAARVAQSGQRDDSSRSGPQDTTSVILAAIQQQGEAIQALAQSVAQMTKAINSFLFADRRTKGSSEGARHRGASVRADEELRRKTDQEWERIERLARAKIDEIKSVRLGRINQTEFTQGILDHIKLTEDHKFDALVEGMRKMFLVIEDQFCQQKIDEQIRTAMRQEEAYEKCAHRRTTCKALEDLIGSYNSQQKVTVTVGIHHHNGWSMSVEQAELSEREPSVEAYKFNQIGRRVSTENVWVDPGRFWSYDLLRMQDYAERPL
jgi:hypothetical protein